MSIFFDYTTFLKNAYQIEKIKLATLISSTTEDDYNPQWLSPTYTNPNAQTMFYSIVNPGHTGTTSAIEYFMHVGFYSGTNPATITYTWQIKASGGAWATLASSSSTFSGSATSAMVFGVYTTAVLLPAEIQLIGTDADAAWSVYVGHGTNNYSCAVRCIGTV